MTASSEDPTAEAATARPEQTSLPRRSRGPSAIAEAAAALGSAAASDPGAVPDPDPESVPPPPMSAAAAEFAALTETGPDTAAPGNRPDAPAGDTAGHRADAPAAPGRWSVLLSARRRKMLLAAAVGTGVGVLVAGSVFLVSGDDSKGQPAAAGTRSDTAVDGGQNPDASGSFGSASPSGGSSALEANATSVTQRPGEQPTPDGSSPASGDNTGDTTPTSKDDTKNGGTQTGSSPGDSAPTTDSGDADSDADTDVVKGVLIRGHASGRCIDVNGGSSADHTRLQIWDCTGAARQKWQISSDGTVRALGKCMDVDGGSREDGAWIKLVTCNGTGAQRFRLNAAHDLVNIQADKCVDVTDQGTGNGAELQLWSCTGGGNQKWSTG